MSHYKCNVCENFPNECTCIQAAQVTPSLRAAYVAATSEYSTDEEIAKWHNVARHTIDSKLAESTGGKTDFYDIGNSKDVDDLAEHWDLRGDEFNCLKALVGIAKGSRHKGTTPMRDANKLVHYATRIQKRLAKQQKENT